MHYYGKIYLPFAGYAVINKKTGVKRQWKKTEFVL